MLEIKQLFDGIFEKSMVKAGVSNKF